MAPLTYFHLEVVEGVLVDVLHLVHQPHGVVGQGPDVRAAHLVVRRVVEAGGCHVGGADGLDLLQLSELVLADDLRRVEFLRIAQFQPQTVRIHFNVSHGGKLRFFEGLVQTGG